MYREPEVSISAPINILTNYRRPRTQKYMTYPLYTNGDESSGSEEFTIIYRKDAEKVEEIQKFINICKVAAARKITSAGSQKMRVYMDCIYEIMKSAEELRTWY